MFFIEGSSKLGVSDLKMNAIVIKGAQRVRSHLKILSQKQSIKLAPLSVVALVAIRS